MASITTINGSDLITNSRAVINTNFTNLNTDKIETSYLDTDTSLTTNSDVRIPTQKAVKTYVDATANPTGASWNAYAVDSVGTDSYAITVSTMTTYVSGQTFKFKAGTANTGACTLNINGLGAKTIKKAGSLDLDTGDIVANQIVEVTYDGTNMQMTSAPNSKRYTAGLTTKNMSDANATQTIAHGLGITPKKVKITVNLVVDQGTQGWIARADVLYVNSTQYALSYFQNSANGNTIQSATFVIYNQTNFASRYVTGTVTVDATNISIAWVKADSPTGIADIMWEAEY